MLLYGWLDALYPGVKICLFGSRARGVHGPGADVDLALDIGCKMDIEEVSTAKTVVEGLCLPYKIDVVDTHSFPPYLKEAIAREGIVWKS